ncbi:cation:proton antiporter regulatory subunit [Longimicrobium sp.]|uniref:cation:proton antiporter regulatory subunit n=1 Tax=Longimicrobium sp. TaxID=2029185 RepID=UPI003B3B2F9B
MQVKEHDLPGVGKKFALTTNEGERMTIVIHNTGHREIYLFRDREDFPSSAVRLEDAEARMLGAILGGAYFQPAVAESMEMVLGQLSVEWVRLDAGSPLAGRTIQASAIRERTGASVIAILRGGRPFPNPGPGDVMQAGDTLLVVGDRQQVQRFRAELDKGGRE